MSEVLELNYENLGEFDNGNIVRLFNDLLRQAVADATDKNRKNDKAARKVSLVVHVKPVLRQDNDVPDLLVFAEGEVKMPKQKSNGISCGVRQINRNGRNQSIPVFNPDSPNNIGQTTMPMGGDDDE